MTGPDHANRTRIAVAVVERNGQFLVGRRPSGVSLAGFAEFPGGKVRPDESSAAAAARECWEESGLEVDVVGLIDRVPYTYEHGTLELDFFACRVVRNVASKGEPRGTFRWVDRAELADLQFPPANREVVARLVACPEFSF